MPARVLSWIILIIALAHGLPLSAQKVETVSYNGANETNTPITFKIHGYFRFRAFLFHNADLLNMERNAINGTEPYGHWIPYSEHNPNLNNSALSSFSQTATRRGAESLAWTDMRFRFEPSISIGTQMRIKTQIDVLDNLVLGATPDGFPLLTYAAPMIAFSQSQIPPSAGINSLRDSIRVKRLWGELMTPYGLLTFGRMGDHWGMGMVANRGDFFNDDYSNNVDRVMFVAKLGAHYFIPSIDFLSEGLLSTHLNYASSLQNNAVSVVRSLELYQGRPHDLDQLDDVTRFTVRFLRKTGQDMAKEQLANGKAVVNYGILSMLTLQNLSTENRLAVNWDGTTQPDQNPLGRVPVMEERDAWIFVGDAWFRLLYRRFRLEVEAAYVYGKINAGPYGTPVDINQFGLAVKVENVFLKDRLHLGFEFGFATGDEFQRNEKSTEIGIRSAPLSGIADGNYTSFKFHPNYRIDRILFREIAGTVCNAFYYRPWVEYKILKGFRIRLDAIYSVAHKVRGWPGKAPPLGLEFDIGITYRSSDDFQVGLSYALLIPLKGLDPDISTPKNEAGVAQAIQTRLVIAY